MTVSNSPHGGGRKFALIHIGTDEVYGLEFVAAELKRHGHTIRWFDGELDAAVEQVIAWQAGFIGFSPLTTYFSSALAFSRNVKSRSPNIRSVFGGTHVTAVPEVADQDGIDIIVVGPVYGTIDQIIQVESKKVLRGRPVPVDMMTPSRREYFEAVPGIGDRHKKTIMTHFGCPYKSSY